MSELPNGWARTTLGDVADWGAGGTPSRSEPSFYGGKIPWIKSGELNSRYITTTEESITEEAIKSSSAKIFPAGSVAIAMYGATIGKTAILGVDASTNQACAVGVPIESLIGKTFLYRLLQREKEAFIEKGKGGAQPNISQAVIKAHEIGLPPLAEQTRIAAKLDELLAQVNTLKARIDGIPALFKCFRQSVLAAAVSGRLTEDWRASNQLTPVRALLNAIAMERSELKARKLLKASFGRFEAVDELFPLPCASWAWVCFDEISRNDNNALKAGPFGSALKKSDCVQAGYKIYGQEQVISGNENLPTYFIDENKFKELEACRVGAEDILISLVGTIGKVLVLSKNAEVGIINPRLVKISAHPDVKKDYLKLYLDSGFAHGFFKRFSHGGTMDILNLGILRELPIPLPSIAEQTAIVRRVEQLFAFADQLEIRVKGAQARIDGLTQSILAKAFRGELLPQDPNDEPAGVLLERIKAQRAATPKAKRARRSAAAG